ncbi:MAG: NifU family protein [Polyangiaceae bacterium]|nr:NifU family protein [Polyangiaceae bacterium]
MATPREAILDVLARVLAPLIEADGGLLFVVSAGDEAVELHLAGRFAGCPGNAFVTRRILEPAVRAVAPEARVVVTWGSLIPAGAKRVGD